jgi:flagellar hook-associated protein 2
MAGIQAPGVGSNLDVNSIVTQLIAAEKAPAEKRLANEEALVQARLSTLGIVKSSFADFQTSIRSLRLRMKVCSAPQSAVPLKQVNIV